MSIAVTHGLPHCPSIRRHRLCRFAVLSVSCFYRSMLANIPNACVRIGEYVW